MSVEHEVLFLAYFDESIAIRELKLTTLPQVALVELYATTTVVVAFVVTFCTVVVRIMPLCCCSVYRHPSLLDVATCRILSAIELTRLPSELVRAYISYMDANLDHILICSCE